MVRTNISIDERIADELSIEASKRNKTLYAFANESISAVLSVCKNGGNPSEVFAAWKLGKMLREIDAVPVLGNLLEKMIRKLYERDKDWLEKAWFDEGQRIGTYLQMSFDSLENLFSAIDEFSGLLPLKRIEVRRMSEPDGKSTFLLRVVGAGLSIEATSCAEQLIAGIVGTYSWSIRKSKISEGILELEISKERRPKVNNVTL